MQIIAPFQGFNTKEQLSNMESDLTWAIVRRGPQMWLIDKTRQFVKLLRTTASKRETNAAGGRTRTSSWSCRVLSRSRLSRRFLPPMRSGLHCLETPRSRARPTPYAIGGMWRYSYLEISIFTPSQYEKTPIYQGFNYILVLTYLRCYCVRGHKTHDGIVVLIGSPLVFS